MSTLLNTLDRLFAIVVWAAAIALFGFLWALVLVQAYWLAEYLLNAIT